MVKYKDMGLFVFIAITAILGIAFLVASANTVADSTNRVVVTNEAVDISSARIAGGGINTSKELSISKLPTTWKLLVTDCLPGATGNGFVLKNQSGSTLSVPSGYVLYDKGNFTLNNTLSLNQSMYNITNVSYVYCSDNYVPGSANKSVLNLVVLFLSIAILVVIIVYFLKSDSYDKLTKVAS